ncbi:hypothetical protein HZ993_08125 [Rhodoferax sp. AJA081-3]|uniref:hypothetical protein n=1 Tax=Rhodoferax sp. AJA081-3 TaxID=2752316 RepID=UPI001AE024D4|nr:hypothetical protein [Rhodoferax sp. AJA081-3]QTN29765.1 hypothetical protein HZ993_08125 [Rhodoferax sp. AJA081-3]
MNTIHTFLLTCIGTAFLTACGGGGGTPVPLGIGEPVTGSLVITPANAKAVAAHALSQTTNRLYTLGAAGPLVAYTEFLSPSKSSLANPTVLNSNSLKTGQVCGAGGAVQVTGSVANTSGLGTGDVVQSTYKNCGVLAYGLSPTYLDGSAMQTVTSGGAATMPFQIVLEGSLDNVRIGIPQAGGGFSEIQVLNGIPTLQWSATSKTVQTLTIFGRPLTIKSTVGGVLRTHNWQGHRQVISINGVYTGYSLDALVYSDNPLFGPTGGSYVLRTLTPVIKDTVSNVLTAGVLRAEGYFNARALISIGTNQVVQVDVDANGDGMYETTVFSTVSELSGLL